MIACLFVMYGADAWQLVNILLMKIKRLFIASLNNDRIFSPAENNSSQQQQEQRQEQQEQQQRQEEDNETNPKQTVSNNFTSLVKITFFFYQTASIIRVQASAKTAYNTSGFIGYMTSIFNIKIDVTKGAVTLCPFDTSSVIIIEAFRSSVPLMSILMIISAMGIFTAATKLKNHFSRSCSSIDEPDNSTTDRLLQQEQPTDHSTKRSSDFLCRLKAAYVNLMLLGYSTVAVFSFHSIHCVSVGEGVETYLFVQASIQCYQNWQVLMIIVITLWVAPFPFVLYAGSRLLHSRRISSNQFLMIITFPPACLPLISGVHKRLDLGERRCREREHILSVLNDPFRGNSNNSDILIWEPVLIGRRLVLVLITTFILSPIMRFYPVGLFLIMFAIHDHLMKPYISMRMNLLQFISTLVLILFLLVNMFWALSNDVDLVKNHQYFVLGEFFIYFESILLILPFIIPLGYLTFKLMKYFIC